jgi:tetratricopeptide (TPR) repeat protein
MRRTARAAVIPFILAAVLNPLFAETQDDKVVRTGAGQISQKMADAATGIFDIMYIPAELIPSGCTGLLFFVTADPGSPGNAAVLLSGSTAKGDMKALARLPYTGSFEGKGLGYYSDGAVVLSMEYPYSTAFVETRWSWDGKSAKLLGSRESDPQKGVADAVRALIKKGDLAAALDAVHAVLYPESYLDSREIGPLLTQLGYKKAMAEYRAGKSDRAARLMSDVFLTDQAAGLLDVESREEYAAAGYSRFLPFEEFIAIHNDYGFFLEQIADPRAIEILSRTVVLDPGRAAAFLNLADALWKAGKRAEAAANYREYARLMKAKGYEKQIPSRVTERSSG